jgi:hypothetical protein
VRSNPKRQFIRHTVHVPLEISQVDGEVAAAESVNLSYGGLAFQVEECPDRGQVLELRIPSVEPPFETRVRVAWCRPEEDGFLVGAAFLDPKDAFRARMVQQVCTIENYRREVERDEGRTLSAAAAVAEWIRRFGGRFPDPETADERVARSA